MAITPVRRPEIARAASELRITLGRLVRRLRSEHPFPISHGAVLGRLDREGAQTASALAAAERVRPQSMAQTIFELEADRLVRRRADPGDRRRWLVELTGHGRKVLEDERRQRDSWLARAISSELSPEEQRIRIRAVPLLRRLTES